MILPVLLMLYPGQKIKPKKQLHKFLAGIHPMVPSGPFLLPHAKKNLPIQTRLFFFLLSSASIHLRLRLCCEDLRVSVDTGHESKSDRSADGLCNLSLVDWS